MRGIVAMQARNNLAGVSTIGDTSMVGGQLLGERRLEMSRRHSAVAKSTWYIEQGLVHMWDGENNLGFGLHAANSGTWKDLYGSVDMAVSSGSFGDNYYTCSQVWKAAVFQDLDLAPVTAEYCLLSSLNRTAQLVFCTGAFHKSGTPEGNLVFRGFGMRGNNTVNFYDGGPCYSVSDQRIAATYANVSAPQLLYYNGMQKSSEGSGATFFKQNSMHPFVGNGVNTYPDNTYNFAGKIYCIRLYNRALSAQEIAYNHEIDVLRFGI